MKRYTLVCLHVYMCPCLDAWSMSICVWLLIFWPARRNLADRKLSNVDYFEVESFDLFKSMLCSEQANARVVWGQLLSLLMLLLYSPFVLSALSLLLSLSTLFLCLVTPLSPSPPAAATVLVFDLYNDPDYVMTIQGTIRFRVYASSSSTQPSAVRWTCGSCMV